MMGGSSTANSSGPQCHLKAEKGILLKIKIASKHKAVLNPLLKSILANSGLVTFPYLSLQLLYISIALLNLVVSHWKSGPGFDSKF